MVRPMEAGAGTQDDQRPFGRDPPSWCEAEAPEGVVVVTIDPGMAFGTAEHETTRGALRLMVRALSPGERLLDAGCGSAILAISAVRLGARHVLGRGYRPVRV